MLLSRYPPIITNCGGEAPEILCIGDSIVRFVNIPNTITYSFSGGKVQNCVKLLPLFIECHPSVHTVIVHAGMCDVMSRQSMKLDG